ncbi:MAG: hypothetical protein Ct9H300mP8_07130 [Gammaproteobacteria bacterium]|nr:MAG: hypothetical protein Ct9H300mP8_07130 [Gammaproteobacteria bacterium]
MSNRAASIAVLTALIVGMLATLAIRPPGKEFRNERTVSGQSVPQLQWRVPVAFSTNLKALGDNVVFVAETLSITTSGAIKLAIYEPGELVPAFNIVDAVREGKVQAGYTWMGYDQGKIPASALIGASTVRHGALGIFRLVVRGRRPYAHRSPVPPLWRPSHSVWTHWTGNRGVVPGADRIAPRRSRSQNSICRAWWQGD